MTNDDDPFFKDLEEFLAAEDSGNQSDKTGPDVVHLKFDPEEFNDIEEDGGKEEFLSDLVKENINDLEILMYGIDRETREEYSDDSLSLEALYFDDGTTDSGVVEVSFETSTYWGCRDMNSVDEHQNDYTFDVDIEGGWLSITGKVTEFEKPSPKDEF